ncbi:outer membrane protein assembly factor BamD [Novilysobacter antarcticus]|uniref:outer membrane protein assembly factor BamD n=1 Tax=Novilysobacter antarcticus TaxID=2862543 RepID=UPI001C99AA63|nr:outer membrane protein assembly factor BamD [Lysobacter antarcticus]
MTHRYAPLRALSLLLIVVLIGPGCSMFKKKDTTPEAAPVEELYEKGHSAMKRGNWSAGAANFKGLVAQYPYGPYTEQALIETAYAQYKAGNHEEAISSIDRFIRTYPTHRNIAYLYYLRGLVNSSRDTVFLQKVWKLDPSRRDLATPHQAYNDFSIVVERYPNSRYSADARERMAELQNTFARHELEVSLYNLRRTAYVAAVERATYLLETYPDSKYQNDAIAALAAAYTGLGNETLAADTRDRLQKADPSHPYLAGSWPKFPGDWRKLNPFAREKSALDY